jgi:hypothetical protein
MKSTVFISLALMLSGVAKADSMSLLYANSAKVDAQNIAMTAVRSSAALTTIEQRAVCRYVGLLEADLKDLGFTIEYSDKQAEAHLKTARRQFDSLEAYCDPAFPVESQNLTESNIVLKSSAIVLEMDAISSGP